MNHEDNIKRLLHVTNEWADMATNGLQWLRNIVEGISDPKAALENMEVCAKHCRAVNDAAVDAMALGEPQEQQFTTRSPELNALLEATFWMAKGPNNHDTVTCWSDALDKVLPLLALGEPVAKQLKLAANAIEGLLRDTRDYGAPALIATGWAQDWLKRYYAQAAQDTPTKQDYREGVNVERLSRALILMGIASFGQEEMAARMSECVNRLTLGIDRYFASSAKSTQQTAATGEVLTDAEILALAEQVGLAKLMTPIGLDTGKVASIGGHYMTSELIDFARAVLEKLK